MRITKNQISVFLIVFILLACFLAVIHNNNPENYFGILIMFFVFIKNSLSKINFENSLIHLLKISLFFYIGFDFTYNIISHYAFDNELPLYNSNNSLIALFIGLLALEISSLFFNGQRKIKYNINVKKINAFLIIFLLLGVINLYLLKIGYLGYGFDVNNSFGVNSFIRSFSSQFTPLITLLVFLIFFNKKHEITRNQKTIFLIALITHIVFGFLSGMKETLLLLGLFYFVVNVKRGKVISSKKILIISISLLILYPLNNSYRFFVNDTSSNLTKIEKYVLAISAIKNFSVLESTNFYLNRLGMSEILSDVMDKEIIWKEYKYLNRYKYFIFHPLIPRFLWPTKPRLDIGQKLYFLRTGRDSNSVSPTTLGWSYLEGGYSYLFFIFFIIGITLNSINALKHKLSFFLLNYLLIIKVIKPEWDFYFLLTEIIQTLILILLLSVLFKIKIVNEGSPNS